MGTKALAKAPSNEALQTLQNEFPVDPGFDRALFPRLSFKAQDVTEGKGKKMKVVTEAGTFFTERQSDEVNKDGKKEWDKEELGKEVEGIIVFQRKQLRMYDEATEEYTSSPIFDAVDEIIPLFCGKTEVHRGTPEELKKHYEYKDKNGKTRSKLEENRILYVMLDDVDSELYQLNLRGSSMYSFLGFARKNLVPSLLVTMNSEEKEKGSIEWNQMTFEPKRALDGKEVETVIAKVAEIKEGIVAEKSYYAAQSEKKTEEGEDDDDF